MTPKQESNIPWWLIVLCFVFQLWPIALVLLFMNLGGVQIPTEKLKKEFRSSQSQYRNYQYQRRQTPPAGASAAASAPGAAAASGPVYTGRQAKPGTAPTQGQAQGQTQGQGAYRYGYVAPNRDTGAKTVKKAAKKTQLRFKKKGQVAAGFLTGGGAALSFVSLLGLVDELSFALQYGLLQYASSWFPLVGFLCGGLVMLGTGIGQTRRLRRLKLYMGVIGQQSSVFLSDLAGAAGVSEKKVVADLQKALADGLLPMGYIDRASGRLVLTDQGYQAPEPTPEPASQAKEKKTEENRDEDKEATDDDLLRQIREVNDAIPDEMMSRKIDRIGEITGKILDYQRRNPAKAPELRQFLNYYLPTTLKILNAYAQMDAQGVEGENISAAKERIEGMMDKVVEGFEKQLDQLFKTDAMDITTDVEVLERMLDKDGLGSGMTMGG